MNSPVDPESEETFLSLTETSQPGLLRELADFLVHNKRWWLVPLIAVLLILGGMIVATSTAIIPAFYMLF